MPSPQQHKGTASPSPARRALDSRAPIPCCVVDVVAGIWWDTDSTKLDYRKGQRIFFLEDGLPLSNAEALRRVAGGDRPPTVYLYNLEEVASAASGGYTLEDALQAGRVPTEDVCRKASVEPAYGQRLCRMMTNEMYEQFRGVAIAEKHWDSAVHTRIGKIRLALDELASPVYDVFGDRELVERLFRDCVIPAELQSELPERAAETSTLWDALCATDTALDFTEYDKIAAEREMAQAELHELLDTLEGYATAASKRARFEDVVSPEDRSDVEACRHSKVTVYQEVVKRLHQLTQLQASPFEGRMQKVLGSVRQLYRQARGRADEAKVPRAFVAALYEIDRQRQFNREFRDAAETFRERLEAARQRELERRAEYGRQHAKHLPKWQIFGGLQMKPCRISKVEPSHGELPDLGGAADLAHRSIVDHMKASQRWDAAAGPVINGSIHLESANVPAFTDDQVSRHADTLADLLLGANAEIGALSAELGAMSIDRDALVARLANSQAELEASRRTTTAAAYVPRDEAGEADVRRSEGESALNEEEVTLHTAVARAETEATKVAELRAQLAVSHARTAHLEAELSDRAERSDQPPLDDDAAPAASSGAKEGSSTAETKRLQDLLAKREAEIIAFKDAAAKAAADRDVALREKERSSCTIGNLSQSITALEKEVVSLRGSQGEASAGGAVADAVEPVTSESSEDRDFICYRGFQTGDRVLFRRQLRGKKTVYAALVARSRNVLMDAQQVDGLISRPFNEVVGTVTDVRDDGDPVEYGLDPGKSFRVLTVKGLLGFDTKGRST
mmetsp:Transcript_27443/g.72081  ORF Transcript_27443/g.72081 Transcript_27443/m.72081 type:complete len:795 (-) Transcript_27443:33-2417(-)